MIASSFKLYLWRNSLTNKNSFTRSDDFGLLEAFTDHERSPLRENHFRDHMIAASLKLCASDSPTASASQFPRSDDRGLIEACCSRRFFLADTDFRDQMIAASLK